MLKNSQTPALGMSEENAIGIGIGALEFLADDPELLDRFLSITGLDPSQLRREASKPAFFAGLLDFLLDHEPTLEAFTARTDLTAETVLAARTALAKSFAGAPR